MNTLQINSKAAQTLARATEKSKKLKPRVRKTSTYGVYEVESSDKSRWYTVTCNSETKTIACNCKASKPCYHVSTIAPIHVYIARQRRDEAAAALAAAEVEAANWPIPAEQSEVPAFDAEVAPVAAPADFVGQVQEIRAICADTAAQLGRAELAANPRKCLNSNCTSSCDVGCDGYCADCYNGMRQDHDDIFGFAPVRRERVKEEW